MKLGVLTSSRADFGIYQPLLHAMYGDAYFQTEIIAFGTHLSVEHGYTVNEIREKFSGKIVEIPTLVSDKDEHGIALSYSDTLAKFTDFWNTSQYDLVLCLGDRYEMNAAVISGIPYRIIYGHFHGGEKTLGAFDNIYRHQITLASKYHFTATDDFADRVRELLDTEVKHVFSVGSLSLSDLEEMPLKTFQELQTLYALPDNPFILCTFHPETADSGKNPYYAEVMREALYSMPLSHHLVISMPNADTNGTIYRKALEDLKFKNPERITLVNSFGKENYFSAMKHCSFLLGNSSSGIIEAASFGKFVIDVGDRQKGRLTSGNVIHVPFDASSIVQAAVKLAAMNETFSGQNKYVKHDTISKVVKTLRSIGNGEL